MEVRAQDLNGNKDATPAKATFEVDATAPSPRRKATRKKTARKKTVSKKTISKKR